MNFENYRVLPGTNIDLSQYDPGATDDIAGRKEAKKLLKANREEIIRLQEQLYAENNQSLLVVFQAMDTGGKDGCIENVFKGVNPSGVRVQSFKAPTAEELAHDFLWRCHAHTPPVGSIHVFNRSHYEDVLVVRVKDLVPESVWSKRYDQINAFEEILAERGTRILKFYLHISKDEQRDRLQSRIDDPNKRWKYSAGDLVERELWDDYQLAFQEALSRCSTDYAPWYVVPANHKWFRDVVVSQVILDTLRDMDPQYPEPKQDWEGVVIPE